MSYARHRFLCLVGWIVGAGYSPATAQDNGEPAAASIIETGAVPWARYVQAVTRLYALHADSPVWLEELRVSPSGRAAIHELLRAEMHGLDQADYQAKTLDSLARRAVREPLSRIDGDRLDALLSVSLIRYLDDLQFGRLHPRVLDRSGADTGLDLARAIHDAIAGDSIPRLVTAAAPRLAQYRNLQRLLARYRQLAGDPSLTPIAPTSTVRVGDRYSEAAALRWRLAAVGDLDGGSAIDLSSRYSADDSAAVRRFQARHGQPGTGELDSATVAELATPFSWRVRQIELALERLRWLPPIGSQRFIVVNIPAFQLFAFDSGGGTGTSALGMRVIVGNALDTRTPVLFERMRYVEFRPYWYVPFGIARKEIIPLVQKDPGYLRRSAMEIVSLKDSVLGDAGTPDILEQIGRGELRLRQRPGLANPLGLVKFVFPNSAAVYLHGTPRPELFERSRRDFSHGCIRIEDPTTLATWVLRDRARWGRSAIAAAQHGATTVRAYLSRPMPVVVWYTTAVSAPDGKARFYSDIYGHDRKLDQALQTRAVTASAPGGRRTIY
jgi:L,D-transpeptidase YcbB